MVLRHIVKDRFCHVHLLMARLLSSFSMRYNELLMVNLKNLTKTQLILNVSMALIAYKNIQCKKLSMLCVYAKENHLKLEATSR